MNQRPIGSLDGAWSVWFRMALAVVPLFLAANLAFTGWVARGVVENAKQIAMIQSNRFSSQDALPLYNELAAMRTVIAAQANDVPEWLKQRIERIEKAIAEKR